MTITIDINKSIEQNAAIYYDKAKKIKKKIEGAEEALEITKKKLKKIEKVKAKIDKEEVKIETVKVKKEWFLFHKFIIKSEMTLHFQFHIVNSRLNITKKQDL